VEEQEDEERQCDNQLGERYLHVIFYPPLEWIDPKKIITVLYALLALSTIRSNYCSTHVSVVDRDR
jgi:hypothetical protein